MGTHLVRDTATVDLAVLVGGSGQVPAAVRLDGTGPYEIEAEGPGT